MKIYAHRGVSARFPENTMPAFEEAVRIGCDGIELDVQLTRDGEVIVLHDEMLDRTTTGTGFVGSRTLEEVKSLDASKGKAGFSKVCIPTLREVLSLLRDTNLLLNIELKTGCYYYKGLNEACLRLVREAGMEDRVLYSSFNPISLLELKKLDPSVRTGFLIEEEMGNIGALLRDLGVDAYHPGIRALTEKGVREARESGMEINSWTITSMEDVRKAMDLSLDGWITNDPALLLPLREGVKNETF